MKKRFIFIIIFLGIVKFNFAQYIFPVSEFRDQARHFELTNFDVRDSLLFLPLGEQGLRIYNVADIQQFELLSTYQEFEKRSRKKVYGTAYGVVVREDKVFLSYGDLGLKIISISDPTMPYVLGTYYRHQPVYCTRLYKDFAFLGYIDMGLEIVDFSNMDNIQMVSRNNVKDFTVNDILINPPYVTIVGGNRGLRTIKFQEPMSTFKQAEFPKNFLTEAEANSLLLKDKTGYMANDFDGLMVLNMGLPLYPLKVNEVKTLGRANDLFIQGHYIYVASDKGIEVFDIREPEKPVKIFEHAAKRKEYLALQMKDYYLFALFQSGRKEFGIEIFQVE
ncbi:MAG: hypothetical protein V2I54_11760 [Bacteroidales bacterium]|jgi:hypothetical protein|nr:hypothetical protein [Bacteroidales bacterium]